MGSGFQSRLWISLSPQSQLVLENFCPHPLLVENLAQGALSASSSLISNISFFLSLTDVSHSPFPRSSPFAEAIALPSPFLMQSQYFPSSISVSGFQSLPQIKSLFLLIFLLSQFTPLVFFSSQFSFYPHCNRMCQATPAQVNQHPTP